MQHVDGRLRRAWIEWLRPLILVVLVVTSFRSAVADWNDVPTGSMKPTILEGDRIVVNKLAYDFKLPFTRFRLLRWGQPARGDIVVLFSPDDGTRLVKRVVGLPGDTLSMRRGRLVVNGHEVEYEPADAALGAASAPGRLLAEELLATGASHPVMLTPGSLSCRSFGPIQVPAARYFVMGDNRDESFDSRHFGVVPRDSIVGRATAVAASLDPQHRYRPRWGRFLTGLR